MKFHSFSLPVAHLLLSGPVPNRPTLVLDHLILPYKSQKVCCDLFLHSFCLFCLFTLICIISVDLSLSPSNLFCYVQSSFIPMGCIVLVTQSCLTLCSPMDGSPPGSSVYGILQARILERVTIPFSRGSSWSRDGTWVSSIAGGFFTVWATRGWV